MLQQTQTSRVLGPWTRFIETFPSPTSCADAPLSDVLRLWNGLRLSPSCQSVARRREMTRDEFAGEVPNNVTDLRRLPGIGEYSSNAVASFGFGRPVAVVDTNVGRVLARALTNRTLKVSEARVEANELLPRTNVASFNQAMLDLGAQFCTSKPRCARCPVSRSCKWNLEGGPDPAPRSAGVSRPQSSSRLRIADRQVRGRVLAVLREKPRSIRELLAHLEDVDAPRGATLIASLVADGLVEHRGRLVHLFGE